MKVGKEISERTYGGASLKGIEFTDDVCVTSEACLSKFEFFLITKQEGLKEPFDGAMGLARNRPFYLSS